MTSPFGFGFWIFPLMTEGLTVMVTMIDAIHDSYFAFLVCYLGAFWSICHNFIFLWLFIFLFCCLPSFFLDLSSLYHFIDTLSLSFFISLVLILFILPDSAFLIQLQIIHLTFIG